MQLITGRTGEQHVKAVDDAELHRTLLGDGDFVLTTGEKFNAKMNGTNELDIYSGTAIMQGRQAKIRPSEGYNAVRFDNGTVGYYRWDVVVIEYSQEAEIEKAELKVIKGVPSKTYVEPAIPGLSGVIDSGENHAMKLWGVRFNGINFDSLVDYRVILDTSPINVALDAVQSAEQEIWQRLNDLRGRGKSTPHFLVEETEISSAIVTVGGDTSKGTFKVNKPAGYTYENTDVFELYLNGLLCRPSEYNVTEATDGKIQVDILGSYLARYDEFILRIWKAVE